MKKIWTVFTATILLCCALFAVSVNAETEEAAVTQLLHSHPVCGARCSCGTFHTDVNWEPLSADATTLSGGHYYLENDVTANDITVTGEVSICLNGNKLTEETSGSCIFVKGSGTLTICDCIGTGVISNTYDIGGSAGCVYLSGASSMTVYGGTIIGGAFDAVACGTTGNLSVCGGTLTGNSDGIGIYEVHDLTISGGTITGTNGDGISCDYGSFQNITISGGQIEGKYSGIQFGEFACSGQVLIQNGTIRSTGSVPNATTFAADYYGLSFKNSNGGTCYLTISGGTFSGERGGFYNHNPNLKATVSDGTLLKSSDYFSAGIYTDAGKFQINGGKIYGITCEGAVNVTVSNGELLYILLSGSDSGSSYLQINGGTIGRVGSQTYAYAINNPMMNPTWRDSVQIYGGTIEGTKYAVRSVSPMDLRIFGGTLSGSNADIYMASTTVSPSEAYISLSGYTGDPLTAETSSSSEIGTYIARNVASDELITLVNDNRSALYDAKHSAVIVTGPHTHSYSNYIPNGNSETAACDYNCGTTDTRIRNAATPVISAQPASETYRIGETANALTVTAGVSDNGTITYQWYENTTASNTGGTAISGAVSANYTPDISAIGTTYYYVIITNTNLSATNKQTVSAVSDVASVTVNSEALPSGTCGDNLTWTLMSDGTLTISGTGPMWDWEEVSLTPWFDYRSDIVSIVLENGVTSIGNSAFVYLPNLTSVSLPEGLVRLGDSCFCNSDSLQTIHFPSTLSEIGAQAFSGAGLTEICLPAAITVVENSAFFGCPELEKVTFLGNVTEIKSSAFGFCSKLKEIALPETVQSIGQSAFFQTAISSVYIPASVQSIEQVAFGGCSQLTSITAAEENAFYTSDAHGVLFTEDMSTLVQYPVGNTATEYSIPSGVKTIGYCAFESCKHLQKVTVPEGVTMLSQAAFGYCSNLSEVILPSSVEIIDGLAFESCVSLTEVTIPQGVVQLRTGAFRDCTALSRITIPASVTRMDKILFSNCPNVTICGYTGSTAEAYAAENSIPFEALDVPEHIFTYALRTYNGEKAAEITGYSGPGGAIEIPATYTHTDGKTYPVQRIDRKTFQNNTTITSVTFPEGLICITGSSFMGTSLTEVTIPASVEHIGKNAFSGCKNLTTAYLASRETVISEYAFPAGCTIVYTDGIAEKTFGDFTYYLRGTEAVITSYTGSGGAVTIPSTVTDGTVSYTVAEIGCAAFENNTEITSVVLPGTVTKIRERAFYGCSALTSVSFPSSLKVIGTTAFCKCSALTSAVLPDGLTDLRGGTFANCTALSYVKIPASVVSTGRYHAMDGAQVEFQNCPLLVTAGPIGSGCNLEFGWTDKLTFQYGYIFRSSKALTTITLPEGMASIDNLALQSISTLTKLVIPASVTNIHKSAISGCPALTIHGYTGSAAETYAAENSIPFVSLGSVEIPDTPAEPDAGSYGEVPLYTGEIVIDGTVDDVFRRGLVIDIAGDYPGLASDTTGKAYLLHDGEYVYVAIEADNGYPLGTYSEDCASFAKAWRENAAELYFDWNHDGGTNDFKWICWADGRYWETPNAAVANTMKQYAASMDTDTDSYVLEAKIAVSQNAVVGDTVGFYLMLDAHSDPATPAQQHIAVPTVMNDIRGANSPSMWYSFTLSEQSPKPTLVLDEDFEDRAEGDFIAVDNSIKFYPKQFDVTVTTLNGNKCAKLDHTDAEDIAGQMDIQCDVLAGGTENAWGLKDTWVYSYDVYFETLSTGDAPSNWMVGMLRMATESGTQFQHAASVIGNKLYAYGSASGTPLAEISVGEWIHFDVEFDMQNKTMSVFMNGECVADALAWTVNDTSATEATQVRCGWASGLWDAVAYVDNFQAYNGTMEREEKHIFTFRKTSMNGTDDVISVEGYSGPGGDIVIPATYTDTNGKTYPVQRIEWRLFQYNTSITSVTFPEGLICIDLFSFKGTSLTEVTIPASVEHIGIEAFADCTSLKTAYLESRDTTFDGSVFPAGCEIVYTDGADIKTSGDFTYYVRGTEAVIHSYTGSGGAVIIPVTVTDGGNTYTVTEIGRRAFADNTSVTAVAIPTTVTYIREQAFYRCTSLAAVSIPAGVTELGKQAFFGCTALTSVVLPDGLTKISGGTFLNCPSLAYLQLPASLSSFGRAHPMSSLSQYEFGGCPLLVTAGPIGSGCNLEFGWTDTLPPMIFDIMDKLTTVTLPEGMTSISRNAFRRCGALTKIVIPASVTDIQKDAVSECPGVTIYGYTGSAAETYAEENSIPFVALSDSLLYGDVNGDTVINGKDLTLIRRFISGGFTLNNFSEEAADVNLDGVINGKDLTLIRRCISGGFDVTLGK